MFPSAPTMNASQGFDLRFDFVCSVEAAAVEYWAWEDARFNVCGPATDDLPARRRVIPYRDRSAMSPVGRSLNTAHLLSQVSLIRPT